MRWVPGDMTAGRRALLAVLQRTQVVYLAARCRVSTQAVYSWTSGHRRPRAETRQVLAAIYGIRATSWDEPTPRRSRG